MAQTAFYDICIIITILKINNEKIGMAAYVFPVIVLRCHVYHQAIYVI